MIGVQCDLRCLKEGRKSCCSYEGCEHYDDDIGCKQPRENRTDSCNFEICYEVEGGIKVNF